MNQKMIGDPIEKKKKRAKIMNGNSQKRKPEQV